ncbi:hypothetical protein FE374_11165 [Georgenia yuyongxinii]|uniref:DUF2993 domain-containing protein n=1 Tax=Georgenia yuyongxinii TaxID=2589797 RepID=A0A5B8C309_9MICO|nr:hypothetical protein [Georgenia yuyongxinii]QDC25089.1 hypothetical protein FE374_11165 [Georgenia yuyongxinii]
MIPVGAGPVPISAAELARRVTAALVETLTLSPEHVNVEAEMSATGDVDRLSIDLSHTVLDARHLAPSARSWRPPAANQGDAPVTVRSLRSTGLPLVAFGTPVTAQLEAQNVPATWARDGQARLWLAFTDTSSPDAPASGRALLEGDVAAASAVIATELARQQGISFSNVRIVPTSAGHNQVRVDVQATAAKGFMKGQITAHVDVRVDDALVLHVEALHAKAGGLIGALAENFIKKRLEPWQNKQIPLTRESFAGARLTDLEIDVDVTGLFRVAATLG